MFNYQGIFTRAQWDVLIAFARVERNDIQYRILHLNQEKTRLTKLREKFQLADTALNGTSLIGNAGDSESSSTPGTTSDGTTAAQALANQLSAQDPTRFVNNYTPTVVGGDKPWRDNPIIPVKLIVGNEGVDDSSNAIIVEDLKVWILDQIKRRREIFEFKLKKINDLIESIDTEVKFLTNVLTPMEGSDYIESRSLTLGGRFTNSNYKDVSLFENAISTRLFPQTEGITLGTTDKAEGQISQEQISQSINSEVDAKNAQSSLTREKPKSFGRSGG